MAETEIGDMCLQSRDAEDSGTHWKLGKSHGTDQGSNPMDTSFLNLPPRELGDSQFLLWSATQFVALGDDSTQEANVHT